MADDLTILFCDQDPISSVELVALRLALDPSVEVKEILKGTECIEGFLLRGLPLAFLIEPFLQGTNTFRNIVKAFLLPLELQRLPDKLGGVGSDLGVSGLQPILEDHAGLRALAFVRAADFDDEVAVRTLLAKISLNTEEL